MKITALVIGLCLIASASYAAEFTAPVKGAQKKTPSTTKTGEPLKPRTTGIYTIVSNHGFQAINPLAPASLGNGEKILTKSSSLDPRVADAKEYHKQHGGIAFFGLEF